MGRQIMSIEGHLWKKGRGRGIFGYFTQSWTYRRFELEVKYIYSSLKYFNGNALKGELTLSSSSAAVIVEHSDKEFGFELTLEDGEILKLAADSAAERDHWIRNLNLAVEKPTQSDYVAASLGIHLLDKSKETCAIMLIRHSMNELVLPTSENVPGDSPAITREMFIEKILRTLCHGDYDILAREEIFQQDLLTKLENAALEESRRIITHEEYLETIARHKDIFLDSKTQRLMKYIEIMVVKIKQEERFGNAS